MNARFGVAFLTSVAVTVGLLSTASTADAGPAAAPDYVVRGVDQGIDYSLEAAADRSAVVARIAGGAFAVDAGRSVVVLRNAAGRAVAEIPMQSATGNQRIPLAATVADNGHRLTLSPAHTPALRRQNFRTSLDWWNYELGRAAPCAGIGALIGAAVGLLFVIVGIIPGALIGAAIGLVQCGGQDLIDSGYAYWGGQP